MLSPDQITKLANDVIEREGGYVNHPSDPGGETKYGISRRSYPTENIKELSLDRARYLYERDFIRAHRLDRLDDYRTAELVLDWLVHSGPLAIRQIQKKLGLTVDGVVGDQTLAALQVLENPERILRWRLDFLLGLTQHPFIKGWVNRLYKLGL